MEMTQSGYICPTCGKMNPRVITYDLTGTYCENCRPVNNPVVPLGWKCPECGKVYAPFVTECTQCGGEGYKITHGYTTTNTGDLSEA